MRGSPSSGVTAGEGRTGLVGGVYVLRGFNREGAEGGLRRELGEDGARGEGGVRGIGARSEGGASGDGDARAAAPWNSPGAARIRACGFISRVSEELEGGVGGIVGRRRV